MNDQQKLLMDILEQLFGTGKKKAESDNPMLDPMMELLLTVGTNVLAQTLQVLDPTIKSCVFIAADLELCIDDTEKGKADLLKMLSDSAGGKPDEIMVNLIAVHEDGSRLVLIQMPCETPEHIKKTCVELLDKAITGSHATLTLLQSMPNFKTMAEFENSGSVSIQLAKRIADWKNATSQICLTIKGTDEEIDKPNDTKPH